MHLSWPLGCMRSYWTRKTQRSSNQRRFLESPMFSLKEKEPQHMAMQWCMIWWNKTKETTKKVKLRNTMPGLGRRKMWTNTTKHKLNSTLLLTTSTPVSQGSEKEPISRMTWESLIKMIPLPITIHTSTKFQTRIKLGCKKWWTVWATSTTFAFCKSKERTSLKRRS